MNHLHRYGVHFILALFLLPIALGGCILVVEEDHRDRRRHLWGTEWYVEVVFYKAQTLEPAEQDVELTFIDETRFEGVSECGAFQGTYSLNEQDELSIHAIESDGRACTTDGPSVVFLGEFVYAEKIQLGDKVLRIDTRGENYILLAEK